MADILTGSVGPEGGEILEETLPSATTLARPRSVGYFLEWVTLEMLRAK